MKSNITFKPVQKKDFQMMHDRLQKDHIQGFYDGGEESFEEYSQGMHDRINNPHQFPYIFFVDDIPVGYMQCYDCYGLAEDVYGELVAKGTWGLDMYIGDEGYLGKGFGVQSLKEFVTFVKNNHKATNITIDPTPDNIRAIGAYKKAGFESIKEFVIDGNTRLLMMYKNNHKNILQMVSQYWSKLGNEFSIRTIQEIHGKLVYLIEDIQTKEKYVVKGLPSKKKQELINSIKVLQYIGNHGFTKFPKIIPTDDGKGYADAGETVYHIIPYIEGTHPKGSAETYAELAKIIAELHNVPTDGCNHESMWTVENEKEGFQPNAEKYKLGEEYLRITSSLSDFTLLPKAIIHTDVHVGNAIKTIEGETYIIDWDSGAVGTRIYDLGFFITMQFIGLDCKFEKEWAIAFFESYEKHINIPLTQQEKECMIDAGLFYSTVCVMFGDVDKNRERIKWIDSNREMICEVIFS